MSRVEAHAVDEFVVYSDAGDVTATVRLPNDKADILLAAWEATRCASIG